MGNGKKIKPGDGRIDRSKMNREENIAQILGSAGQSDWHAAAAARLQSLLDEHPDERDVALFYYCKDFEPWVVEGQHLGRDLGLPED